MKSDIAGTDPSCRRVREVALDDQRVTWAGAIDVEHAAGWSRGWRLPFGEIDLFPGAGLRDQAAMSTGIRLEFSTDATAIEAAAVPSGEEVVNPVDLVVDGSLVASAYPTADGLVDFPTLPPGEKSVELWLPQYGDFRLTRLTVNAEARIRPSVGTGRRRLITYGSSITQCRTAASPTQTWPALAAAALGMDLTCLGFGSECHLDPMIARLIRDRPADVVVTCLGVNIHSAGTFTERSLPPAVLGFLSTIRDGHATIPIVVVSPIVCPSREAAPGPGGMTLSQVRSIVEDAVRRLAEHGDDRIHLVHGPEVFGPEQAHRLGDGVHPDAAGYVHLAGQVIPRLRAVAA